MGVRRRMQIRRRTSAVAALTHAASAVAFVRRARVLRKRIPRALRRVGFTMGRSPASMVAIVRRARQARRRPARTIRRLGAALGRAAAGATPFRLKRLRRIARRFTRPRPPFLPDTKAPANNKAGPAIRFRRAVAKIREAMIRRLRWKPRPDQIVPEIEPPHTPAENVIKGRIAQPGLVRGRIVTGGM